jgi:lambda repressor-like predicted transcriptional regulator
MPVDCRRARTASAACGLRPSWKKEHHGARVAQALAGRLQAAIEKKGWSVAEVSRRSGVARYTIAKALAGEAWPDLLTIANRENALDVDLWPGREV